MAAGGSSSREISALDSAADRRSVL